MARVYALVCSYLALLVLDDGNESFIEQFAPFEFIKNSYNSNVKPIIIILLWRHKSGCIQPRSHIYNMLMFLDHTSSDQNCHSGISGDLLILLFLRFIKNFPLSGCVYRGS